MRRSWKAGLRRRILGGPLAPVYRGTARALRPVLGGAVRLWPGAWKEALAEALTMPDLRELVELKIAKETHFSFDGKRLPYCFHSYNAFRVTERSLEIPIVGHYLKANRFRRVLEIGNVLAYYYSELADCHALEDRVVVDKLEHAYGARRCDVAEFTSEERFDFICSVSTFEHMDSDRGFNRHHVPGRSRLSSVAADNVAHVLENLLAPGGTFLLTSPVGYSEEWDRTLYSGELDGLAGSTLRLRCFEKTTDLRWEPAALERAPAALEESRRIFPEMSFLAVLEFRS